MQQIADWLKKLGMSEYAERFAGRTGRLNGILRRFSGKLTRRRAGMATNERCRSGIFIGHCSRRVAATRLTASC
jgi:hypothetical protein